MMQGKLGIYVMSYQRSNCILTQNLFDYCTYVVRQEEVESYKKSGVKNILPIPSECVRDFMSTLYWIIKNTPEDVIFVADDDIKNFIYRFDKNIEIQTKDKLPDRDSILSEIERIAQLIYDLDIGLAFDSMSLACYNYTQEFTFKGMPGHVRWINKKCLKAVYDEDDFASSDIDMMMQELLHNRIVLQPRYFCSQALADVNAGAGNADRQSHLVFIEHMKNKWGRCYDYDHKRNIAKINVKR